MRKNLLATLLALPLLAMVSPPPSAPPEVMAAAPKDATLLFFKTSGNQANADAAAVFETAPDKDGVRWRTLSLFGKKDGKFVPDFSSDKLIACSKCSQFHDDPFYPDAFKVNLGNIHIDQVDGGEKPSSTSLGFSRKSGIWKVTEATQRMVDAGRYNDRTQKLPLPSSGLAKDMDAKWILPWYLNTILINNKDNTFSFLHGDLSNDAVWKRAKECNLHDCTILIQKRDGCLSLVRDSKGKSYAGSTDNPKAEDEAKSSAMNACATAGGVKCENVRTDCSKGIF